MARLITADGTISGKKDGVISAEESNIFFNTLQDKTGRFASQKEALLKELEETKEKYKDITFEGLDKDHDGEITVGEINTELESGKIDIKGNRTFSQKLLKLKKRNDSYVRFLERMKEWREKMRERWENSETIVIGDSKKG